MTLILGIEEPDLGRAILACDSGAWKDDQVDTLVGSKIWRSGGWCLGLTGTWGQSQRVRMIQVSEPESQSDDDAEGALLSWLDRTMEALACVEERRRRVDTEEKARTPAVLAAHDSRVWYVADGEATRVQRGWQAIGCADYALGAMAALRRAGPRGAVWEARATMRAVETVTRSILGPFRWMGTDGAEGTWETGNREAGGDG